MPLAILEGVRHLRPKLWISSGLLVMVLGAKIAFKIANFGHEAAS